MNDQSQTDHDLLIELRTEVKGIRDEIKRMNDGGKIMLDDHEVRLRSIEKYVWTAIGGAYILNAIIGFYLLYKK